MTHEIILTTLIAMITSIAGWFAARRKNTSEIHSTELDNVQKAVKYYRDMLDDMVVRHREALKELDDIKAQLKELMDDNKRLVEELKKYKQLSGKDETSKNKP